MVREKNDKKLHFYLIIIAYDGSDFAGWATQPNEFTIQGCIETILSKVFQKKISILAASRTDKGVHAREQKFTLRIDLDFSEKKLFILLKKVLGKYVLVKKVKKVDDIFQKKYRWEFNFSLETKKLNHILQIFQGQHNFFNYSYCCWQEREKTNTERKITSLKSWKRKSIVVISIIAKSFLRYQIRAIIGEVINCYEGKQNIKDLQAKLTNFAKKNYKYKNIAPASGLYLWKVNY